MPENSYSNGFFVSAIPSSVYKAITIDINKWWSPLSNEASKVGDKLTIPFGEKMFKTIKLTEAKYLVLNNRHFWE
jgi:hypothetical protein